MEEVHVLIEVSGGCIQYTSANKRVTLHIVDHDNIEAEGGEWDDDSRQALTLEHNLQFDLAHCEYHSGVEVIDD